MTDPVFYQKKFVNLLAFVWAVIQLSLFKCNKF